jgi:hypothetical protein
MLTVEDLQPRKSRWGKTYCILYTNANQTICCSESDAQKIALYEPYQMHGLVHPYHGGMYLRLEQAMEYQANSFKNAFSV